MRLRFGLVCVVAVLLGGCGGKGSTTSTPEPAATSTVAPEEAAQKQKEAEEKLKSEREEEKRIHEHEPGGFGN
jgi:hypothetical protein